jgi:catechol 2,3-dioxygenase-like lactoylglutathione lyase family enzyme/ribosomal protein S18 acetylase RimI-like enzyme
MLIRPTRPDDDDALWHVLSPVFAAGESYCLPRDIGREAALDYWRGGEHRAFVAEADGAVVGSYFLCPNQRGGGAHVANAGLATAPAAAGRGVARAMLAHCLDEARRTGFRAMQFNFVVASNIRAIALWRAAGFQTIGRLPGAFLHPSLGTVDALVMYRPLDHEPGSALAGFEHVGMTVSDLDRSLHFYQGLLGMRLLLRRASPGSELAFLDAGGGQLELVRPAGEVATPAHRPSDREAGIRHVTFAFDDVDALFDRLLAAGVAGVETPRDAHNRDVFARVAYVRDPDGMVVELVQRAD